MQAKAIEAQIIEKISSTQGDAVTGVAEQAMLASALSYSIAYCHSQSTPPCSSLFLSSTLPPLATTHQGSHSLIISQLISKLCVRVLLLFLYYTQMFCQYLKLLVLKKEGHWYIVKIKMHNRTTVDVSYQIHEFDSLLEKKLIFLCEGG